MRLIYYWITDDVLILQMCFSSILKFRVQLCMFVKSNTIKGNLVSGFLFKRKVLEFPIKYGIMFGVDKIIFQWSLCDIV